MRALGILAATAALMGSALVATPAQAAGGTLTVSMNLQTGVATVVPSVGMSAFGAEEELRIASETPGGYTITLYQPTHTLVAGSNCIATTSTKVVCSSVMVVPKLSVLVDMSKATVGTTVAVLDGTFVPALTFYGGSGPDYVQGGSGPDQINGGPGVDALFGGPGDDKISGDENNDNVEGEEGNDSVGGGTGDDYVTGDAGFDSMTGGPGVDELDAEDGVQDTLVSCDNEPGKGAIAYDKDLDIPFDCPVVLAPTMPLDVNASASQDSITVGWAPSAFDGNSQQLKYRIYVQPQFAGEPAPIVVAGTESSYTVSNLSAQGLYWVWMQASNEVGVSPTTARIPVAVGSAPSPPQSVANAYIARGNATLSWVAPADVTDPVYEIALRVKDKRNRSWLAWQTLPDRVASTSVEVGDDLRIVNGRLYQFRVRTVDAQGKKSAWATSPVRYVGNLTPPVSGEVTLQGAGSRTLAHVRFNLPGLAWIYNAKITNVFFDNGTPNAIYGLGIDYVDVHETSFWATFTGTGAPRTKDCAFGLGYNDAAGTHKFMWAKVACPI